MEDQKILCATDGSAPSDKAVAHAIFWASQLRQSLAFITVTNGSALKYMTWDEAKIAAGDLPVDKPLLAALEKARAAELTNVVCVRGMNSDIAEAVVTYAEKNGYHHIIAGSVGRTGIARHVVGSVAEDIVTRAHCPVTIVR